MTETISFKELLSTAREKLNDRTISPLITAGEVASAILTEDGNVYTGVCVDTACGLGMCAERNAIANMITNGECKIVKLVCISSDGSMGSPCGACREFLMQLHPESGEMEILMDEDKFETKQLKELVPDWWGEKFFTGNNT